MPSMTSSPAEPGPRQSALSNKITSVLSTSYADPDIREALGMLDQRGLHNSAEARRRLRLDVQKEVMDCNGAIIQDFGQVAEQVRRIGSVIDRLQRTYKEIIVHIDAARQETDSVVTDTNAILSEQDEVKKKQRLLDIVRRHFTLSPELGELLTSTSEPVADRFFAALARVKSIHHDCQILLGYENQRLGLDIMEQSSKTLNGAFEKLYRWTLLEFKTLDVENPRMSSNIRRALRALAERPTLFESCLDFLAEAREQMLSEAFLAALTGASARGEESHGKPIELVAHDPMRYLGDMLAWVHSAAVSERESLEALFLSDGDELAKGVQAGMKNDPWSRSAGGRPEDFNGAQALSSSVNRSLRGVGSILRQRVEQTISGHDDAILAYRIAGLIRFYRSTFQKLLGPDASVLEVLDSGHESALRQFHALMAENVGNLPIDAADIAPDLSVPDFVKEALELLEALMTSYEASYRPGSGSSEETEEDEDGQAVFTAALDPVLARCQELSEGLDDEHASRIFLLNCLLAAKNAVAAHPFAATALAAIDARIDALTPAVIEQQHAFFLHSSGLHPLLVALTPTPHDPNPTTAAALRSSAVFQPAALAAISQQLDHFLASAVLDATENLALLADAKLLRDATDAAAQRFCADFEFVEAQIVAMDDEEEEEKEKEEETKEEETQGLQREEKREPEQEDQERAEAPRVLLRSLFPRTSAEIRVLLS
ncbi:MAG: Golgi transport complex subunit 6 [Phylliscum demangeonii]|nr:MAG: Golgi transport complex subunit 6 [Phylliscum demangeonii]